MQIALATFGIMALMFAGCTLPTSDDVDTQDDSMVEDEMMEESADDAMMEDAEDSMMEDTEEAMMEEDAS